MKGIKITCFVLSIIFLFNFPPMISSAGDSAISPVVYQYPGIPSAGNPGGADAANTQTVNNFWGRLINGDDIKWGSPKDEKDKKYDDPWPWWRDPWWRYNNGYPWSRSSGWGPGWGSPPIGDPARDAFESGDSKEDKQTQQDYENEVNQRVLRDDWAERRKRRYPTLARSSSGSADRSPAAPQAGGGTYDDATLVAQGYKDWYDTFGLPIPGLDGLVDILKPNIYLYSDKSQEVTVAFSYPELLTVSIPDYSDGWRVGVSTDGTLMDESGSYGFLFYESKSGLSDFQTDKGFRLDIEKRDRQLKNILDAYGFNETEKADFIEFWTQILDPGRVYVMYPQGTKILDNVMPVFTNPEPDNIFRLWFGFEATDKTPDAPAIEKITRGGLTFVEWGGFIIP